ncbi:Na+/H+ antiporter subunit E [Brevibacterium luteolum]|uniref:Sodium:proton antiporter n=1 Tax=Brevibacterium luteolum TaxID=199591 RepID=A0A6G8KUZ0_9MICO|nr:Na+/H+ antiporter subunit E [Brevibacterium luteolum]QIN28598.1 sodium:proton antiporter [Brevibacterium luteolum]
MFNPISAIGYSAWILKEVVVGSVDVITHIFQSGGYGHPMIVELPLRCVTDVEVTLMASSITITPGTLVVAVGAGDERRPPTLFVHVLFADSEDEALEGLRDMESRLLKVTRGRAPGKIREGNQAGEVR